MFLGPLHRRREIPERFLALLHRGVLDRGMLSARRPAESHPNQHEGHSAASPKMRLAASESGGSGAPSSGWKTSRVAFSGLIGVPLRKSA